MYYSYFGARAIVAETGEERQEKEARKEGKEKACGRSGGTKVFEFVTQ
jgi:hypothetical protein